MPAFFMWEGTVSKVQDANFDWHAEVGNREMRGTAANAAERELKKSRCGRSDEPRPAGGNGESIARLSRVPDAGSVSASDIRSASS